MQSGDGDPLTPVNHRITQAWTSFRNLKRVLTDTKLPTSLRLPTFRDFRRFIASLWLRIVEVNGEGMQKAQRNMFENVIKNYRKRDR